MADSNNTVTVSGMFGNDKTYFSDSPVVIDISGLEWPEASPFNVVHVDVEYDGAVAGDFRQDTGGQGEISLDISSALRALWADYDFSEELAKAQAVINTGLMQQQQRAMRPYSLRISTEYLASDGVYTRTTYKDSQGRESIPGGQCLQGGLTEWERATIGAKENADVSHWEHTGVRNGDASTKPTSSPERIGRDSITSWTDLQEGYTKTIFYPKTATPEPDDTAGGQTGWNGHVPLVLRDSRPYTDFLIINRRGAMETCSAHMLEALSINVDKTVYGKTERPSFSPTRSLITVNKGGARRSYSMSSGHQTREWAEWWTTEFLTARRVWMLYQGLYVPVVVEPAKKDTGIYDRAKQQMPSVEFTVTLALEG